MGGFVDAEESYCLKWNDFHTSVTASFADLRRDSDLFDITLICEGRPLLAHKVILSACSQVFRQMLKTSRNPKEPTILLWNIKHSDMEALLNFMYMGEVNITHDKLNHFLDLAEKLKVKGLTSNGEKPKSSGPIQTPTTIRNPLLPNKPLAISNTVPGTSLLNPLLAKKPTNVEQKKENSINNSLQTESITVKDELNKIEMTEESMDGNDMDHSIEHDVDDNDDESNPLPVVTEMQTDDTSEHDFDPTAFLTNESTDDLSLSSNISLPQVPTHFIQDASPALLTNQVEPVVGPDGTKEFPCQYCEKRYLTRSRLKRHVLDVHEKGEYPCPDCGKIFSSTRRLKDHQRSRYCHGVNRAILS